MIIDIPELHYAFNTFGAVVEIDPNNPELYRKLGEIYLNKKEFTTAIKQFKKALQLDPQDAETRYKLGQAYLKMGRIDEGEKEIALSKKLKEK